MQTNPCLSHHGKFSTIESKIKEMPIIGFDTEDDSKGTPLLFGFYGDFKKKKYVSRFSDKALEFIYDIEEPTIFVAHNLEYDIANLFKDSNYLMVDKMMYSSSLLRVDLYGTKHFFLNTHSYFKGKLADMGKLVGINKLEGDPLSEKYLIQDAKIAYKFTKMFQERVIKEAGVNLGVTIGKMSMDTYRRSYMLSKKQITYNSPNCLKAYYGGRVEIFKKGVTENINVVDINSCYPFVMKEYEYPSTKHIEPSTLKTHKFGIGKFTVNVPDNIFVPVLPYKSKEGRLFFPKGTFTGWWTYAEVRYAVSTGTVILKEHEGEGTNSGCRPFANFIETFYDKRVESKIKIKKNPNNKQAVFDILFYKFWLNNLYGKWCQHKDGNEMTRDKWPKWKLDKYINNENFKTSKIGPFYNYTVPKTELPKTANFMWGIYVTSYSRIYLHEGITKVHNSGHTLLYTDTDSIMYSPCSDVSPFNLTDKLGDWDIEKYALGIFRQSKGYLLCDKDGKDYLIKKVACKGVPTHMAYDFIVEGLAKVWKPMRLKEALIRVNAKVNKDKFLKDVGENIWSEIKKKMQSIYIKRQGDSITYPVDARDISELETNTSINKISIKKELAKDGINIKKNIYKNNFENTVIPSGYFNKSRSKKRKPRLLLSQKIFNLASEQCLGLAKGENWFTGDILKSGKKRNGKPFYQIFITNYKGKKLKANFWGRISHKFFEAYNITEDLFNKKVDVKLNNFYFDNSSLDLSIKVSESTFKGQLDNETLDESSELSEKQLKTLMAFDWSKIE